MRFECCFDTFAIFYNKTNEKQEKTNENANISNERFSSDVYLVLCFPTLSVFKASRSLTEKSKTLKVL